MAALHLAATRAYRQLHAELPMPFDYDIWHMTRALELAARGLGHVEPNPMVGCVVAHDERIVGEGWHQRFGGPHAEVEALAAAGRLATGATMYVSLEPCRHQGKTPPCTQAIIAAGIRRVVAAVEDPSPEMSGRGLAELRAAGVEVETGLLADESRRLLAPYLKLLATGRPWVIAKWAMTLDGKMATRTGESRWISGEASRRVVHQLRGRVDAVMIGRRTAEADDPLLTARPPGPRRAMRVVLDTHARLASESQLVRTARDVPVLVAATTAAAAHDVARLTKSGCEVAAYLGGDPAERLDQLLLDLGRRRMTNVLVEGGGTLLGALFDLGQIDEVHVFIAPKLLGGKDVPAPLKGLGVENIAAALALDRPQWEQLEGDMYVHGRVARGG